MATIGIGLVVAPWAAAGPAPANTEQAYLNVLDEAGISVAGAEGQELQLAYLTCALKEKTGQIIDGTAPYLGAAKLAGLCSYAGSGLSLAQAKQQLQAMNTQSWAPQIANILDTDADDDGYSDANDSDPYYRGDH